MGNETEKTEVTETTGELKTKPTITLIRKGGTITAELPVELQDAVKVAFNEQYPNAFDAVKTVEKAYHRPGGSSCVRFARKAPLPVANVTAYDTGSVVFGGQPDVQSIFARMGFEAVIVDAAPAKA
jgi:hypothetical protein